MATGNKYLSVHKFLGMCINHKRGHYTSGESIIQKATEMLNARQKNFEHGTGTMSF
jgi:hypothetical protein